MRFIEENGEHLASKGKEMDIDEKTFFREATLRICGSLEIKKALGDFFAYVKDYIPATRISMGLFDLSSGFMEAIATSTAKKSENLSNKFPISPELNKLIIERWPLKQVRLFEPMSDNEIIKGLEVLHHSPTAYCITLALVMEGDVLGLLAVIYPEGGRPDQTHIDLLALLNKPFAIALSNYSRYRKLMELQDLLMEDRQYLQEELRKLSSEDIVGADFGLKEVLQMVYQVAPLDSPVLLLGETGTGKELIAANIHSMSPRCDGPLIRVNCGAIPDTLIDSELFGYEKGAFTGALKRKRGHFERAHGGTIFLDEIGELPMNAQVRLLRVLQEKKVDRVGGTDTIDVDIRVIAATHRNLEAMVANETFREDLYFRLKVFPITIPPLRDRSMDIPALVQHFFQKKTKEMKLRKIPILARGEIRRLMSYGWPGNVRELENAVERAMILSRGGPITFSDIGPKADNSKRPSSSVLEGESLNLDQAMARHIKKALDIADGKVEGKGGAAEILGVNPRTLRHRMRKLGVLFGRMAKNKRLS
jgi:formate hydrogenlyase transcriptional activator